MFSTSEIWCGRCTGYSCPVSVNCNHSQTESYIFVYPEDQCGLGAILYIVHTYTIIQFYILYVCVCVYSVAQSCPTLCDPMYCSPPASSVHEVFQARILERVTISYSRGFSWPKDWTHVSCVSCIGRQVFYHVPPGKSRMAPEFLKAVLSVADWVVLPNQG